MSVHFEKMGQNAGFAFTFLDSAFNILCKTVDKYTRAKFRTGCRSKVYFNMKSDIGQLYWNWTNCSIPTCLFGKLLQCTPRNNRSYYSDEFQSSDQKYVFIWNEISVHCTKTGQIPSFTYTFLEIAFNVLSKLIDQLAITYFTAVCSCNRTNNRILTFYFS